MQTLMDCKKKQQHTTCDLRYRDHLVQCTMYIIIVLYTHLSEISSLFINTVKDLRYYKKVSEYVICNTDSVYKINIQSIIHPSKFKKHIFFLEKTRM